MIYKHFCQLLIALVLTAAFSEANADKRIRLQQVSLDQGLSQAEVTNILQDNQGFLWFGTQQGLNLYDGYRLRLISGPRQLLETQATSKLFQDSANRIWIGSPPNETFILNKQSNEISEVRLPYPDSVEILGSAAQNFYEDDNYIWLSTYFDIFKFHKETETIEFVFDFKPLTGQREIIRALHRFENYLLIGISNGLYALDTNNNTVKSLNFHDSLPNKSKVPERDDRTNIKGITLNQQGNYLISTVEGLYQLTPEQLKTLIEQPDTRVEMETLVAELNVWKVIENNHSYWLATNDGLYKLSKDNTLTHIFRYSDTPYQSADNNIIEMVEDREGNLWFGSRNDGAFKLTPNFERYTYYQQGSDQQSISNNRIWIIRQDKQNNIWVGTRNGLNKINADNNTVEQYFVNPDKKVTVSDSTVSDMEINNSQLWVSTAEDIKIVDTKTGQKIENTVLPEPMQKIMQMGNNQLHFTDNDNLLILNREGAHQFNTQTKEYRYIENTNPKGNIVNQLFQVIEQPKNDNNTLLISMVDQVVEFDLSTGQTTPFHALPPSDKPRTFAADAHYGEKYVWIAYSGFGVYVIDRETGEQVKHISSLDGLPDNSLFEFHEDKQGTLWGMSNSGLIRFNQNNFHFRVFDTNDGLSTNEFNGGASGIANNGDLLLGTIKGVMRVDPNKMKQDYGNIEFSNHITDIKLMSRELPISYRALNTLELEVYHTDYGLKVAFSTLLYTNSKKINFKYSIEGSTNISPTEIEQSELFLPMLESGENQVKITAIDYETGKESKPVFLNITAYPAPYLSWWAYTLYVVVIGSLLLSIYYQRHKRRLALLKSHNHLQQSEERLKLALEGSDSGLWDWQRHDNQVFDPRALLFYDSNNAQYIDFDLRLELIHRDDKKDYIAKWIEFSDNAQQHDVFEHIYRLKSDNNSYRWFKDLARISEFTSDSKPLRITGTYTDITERKDEHDKVNLFSQAFDNTRDIIIILDSRFSVTAVNQSFNKISGLDTNDVLNKPLTALIKSKNEEPIIYGLKTIMESQDQCESEALINRKYQSPLPVLVSATKFTNDNHRTHYVLAVTDISEQKKAQDKLKRLANYDSLTGLPNRALLIDRVSHAIEQSKRRNQKLALFFIDLDRFKQINDTLGHEVGDLLLIKVSEILRSSVRSEDTVARLGGDEFVIMLEDVKQINIASKIAQSILDKMSGELYLEQHKVNSSPSIGISFYPEDGNNPQEIIRHADMAMYHAKNKGRNNFQFFKQTMNDEAQDRLSLETQLRKAVKQNEFHLVYQPQVDIITGKIKGFEALARWTTAEGEMIPPTDFIPLAEELGLIIPMTEQFIASGLQQLQQWHDAGFDCGLSINLSARHLKEYDLVSFMNNALKQYQFKAGALEFELTESLLMDDIQTSLPLVTSLQNLGIELALDDFGTGYSSLKYLHQLPIHKLKIDRSFVSNLGKQPESEAIIETILSLSTYLDLKTVVEGVETEQQLTFIKQLKAQYVQGYYFSKPVSSEQTFELLKTPFKV